MCQVRMTAHLIWASALVVCVFIVSMCLYNAYADHEFRLGGYSMHTLPGHSGPEWVKPKDSQ